MIIIFSLHLLYRVLASRSLLIPLGFGTNTKSCKVMNCDKRITWELPLSASQRDLVCTVPFPELFSLYLSLSRSLHIADIAVYRLNKINLEIKLDSCYSQCAQHT